MRYRRSFRRSARRTGPIVQSFKKVLNHAPSSIAAGTNTSYAMVAGVDSVAAGQTTAIDDFVPTGAIVKYIEFQYSGANLVNVANFLHFTVQHLRSGQAFIASDAVGGNPIRNQVHLQVLRTAGQLQNTNVVIRFKVPKKYQRVREGDSWVVVVKNSAIITAAAQVIYKFYR